MPRSLFKLSMIALVVAVLWALKPLPTVASGNFTSKLVCQFKSGNSTLAAMLIVYADIEQCLCRLHA